MNIATDSPQSATKNTALWVAIGVLGLAVLGMGATLIRTRSQPSEPPAATASAVVQPMASAEPAASVPSARTLTTTDIITEPKPPLAPEKPAKLIQSKAAVHTNKTQTTTNSEAPKSLEPIAKTVPQPVLAAPSEPAVARAPAKPVCANCGTIERVTPVERDGNASGVGVVAGGVLGAVVGNQVGGGDGKTLATILGAVGGGMAGNAVEKKMKKVTHYEVTVRMEDGSTRTVVQSVSASVGARVTVDGNTLHGTTP